MRFRADQIARSGRPAILQGKDGRIVADELARPPHALAAAGFSARKAIPVKQGAKILWRVRRKRIALDQFEHLAVVLQQAPAELLEPPLPYETAERRKPHLPIQPRLMRRHPRGPAMKIARLVLEPVFEPVRRVL